MMPAEADRTDEANPSIDRLHDIIRRRDIIKRAVETAFLLTGISVPAVTLEQRSAA
jgi:hypothetical protein